MKMNRTLSRVALRAVASLSLAATVAAQDPLTVSPSAYRLEFENAWVKVVRVLYGPKAVIAPHFHTERASAYVYLNDGGPIVFKHEGLPYAGVTRPATKAGSFRVYKGIEEVHSVENPTDAPSEFLRVEFKTDPVDAASLKGKFYREEPMPRITVQRAQFENAQVRITRAVVPPGATLELTSAVSSPSLIVALTGASIEQHSEGTGPNARRLGVGQVAWAPVGGAIRIVGRDTALSEVLRFEFKTRPLEQR